MKSLFKSTVLAAAMALGALGLTVAPAAAATVTPGSATVTTADTGFSWTVNFICSAALPCNGGNPGATLAARAIFTITGVTVVGSETFWDIGLVVRNTSSITAGGFLTALGFATDPNSTLENVWDANSTGANWSGGSGSIPGFSATELCVYDGNNCSAANNHAMTTGIQDRLGFTLTTGLVNALTFTDFAVKWAGTAITGGSYETGGTVQVAPVPLPAAGGLLLVGLAGLVALRRKQKAA